MAKLRQVYWFENGIVKTYVGRSISQIKRVKHSAKERGAVTSNILPAPAPLPVFTLAKKRSKDAYK